MESKEKGRAIRIRWSCIRKDGKREVQVVRNKGRKGKRKRKKKGKG